MLAQSALVELAVQSMTISTGILTKWYRTCPLTNRTARRASASAGANHIFISISGPITSPITSPNGGLIARSDARFVARSVTRSIASFVATC